jgi:predicted acylesterase/phospholipase RssA
VTPPRVVAVLSGGGAKAAAHIGAVSALTERGLAPAHYVATSMGALAGALLAAGLSAADARARLMAVRREDIARPRITALLGGIWSGSLLRPAPFRRALARVLPVRRFAELAVPLTVTATDYDTGQGVRLGAGGEEVDLLDAIEAACALPLYLPPVRVNGLRLVDGGLRAALPLWAAESLEAGLVVALDVGPRLDEVPAAEPSGVPPLLRYADGAIGILMAHGSDAEIGRWRATPGRAPLVVVRPRMPRHATFRTDLVPAHIDEGRRATLAAFESAAALTAQAR